MERQREERSQRPELRELTSRVLKERHRFVDATDVAERAAELEEAPRADLAGESGGKGLFVQRDRLLLASGAVVLAAALIQLDGIVRRQLSAG